MFKGPYYAIFTFFVLHSGVQLSCMINYLQKLYRSAKTAYILLRLRPPAKNNALGCVGEKEEMRQPPGWSVVPKLKEAIGPL